MGGAALPLAVTMASASTPAFADAPEPKRPSGDPRNKVGTELWYPAPADDDKLLHQGLPIGNGRLGALVGGNPSHDLYFVTDASLWSGGLNDSLNSNGQFPYAATNFGSFTMLAKAAIDLPGHSPDKLDDYRRSLDLDNGIVTTTYRKQRTSYRREVFASEPDDVIVIRMTSRGRGKLTGKVTIAGTHHESTDAAGSAMSFNGALDNDLKYAAAVSVHGIGGRVANHGDAVSFSDCREVTVIISGGTNYAPDAAAGFRNKQLDPLRLAMKKAARAARTPSHRLLHTHVADYQNVHGSMSVSLGKSTDAQRSLDTWERLKAKADSGTPDPELEASYLQFGRYLMFCSSRGGLPANLQGLWIDRNDPSWMGDYHTDINLQMNYWIADRSGLGDSFDALADYLLAQVPSWAATTKKLFNDERNGFRNSSGKIAGWTTAISTNVYGGLGWWWHPAGNAWLSNLLFTHYEFTQSRDYLKKIMPLLRGACEFWEARLITDTVTDPRTGETHTVLIDDSDWSPEQGPTDAKGITYAQELVWQLFGNFTEAAGILHIDDKYAARIAAMRDKLYLPQVSPKSGKLEEWMSPDDLGSPTHRHLSPLVGLFPGDRIRPDGSPKWLLDGATKLLTARGMESYGWGCAWRALAWARLKDGDKAYQLVTTNLKPSIQNSNGTAMNFFDIYSFGSTSSTFQIDANFGTPSAMLEMLVYSRPGVIELLPALPKAWAHEGSVTGIGARGGFVVDVAWRHGRITTARIRSVGGRRTTVRTPSGTRHLALRNGESAALHG